MHLHTEIAERRASQRAALAHRTARRERLFRRWRTGTVTSDEVRKQLVVIQAEARDA